LYLPSTSGASVTAGLLAPLSVLLPQPVLYGRCFRGGKQKGSHSDGWVWACRLHGATLCWYGILAVSVKKIISQTVYLAVFPKVRIGGEIYGLKASG